MTISKNRLLTVDPSRLNHPRPVGHSSLPLPTLRARAIRPVREMPEVTDVRRWRGRPY